MTTFEDAQIEALLQRSEQARVLGDHVTGARAAQEAMDRTLLGGQTELEARALGLLALHHHRVGDFVAAMSSGERAIDMYERLGDIRGRAGVHCTLTLVYITVGLIEDAIRHGHDASRLAIACGDEELQCWAMVRLALVHDSARDTGRAIGAGREALALARHLDDDELTFACTNNLALVLVNAALRDESHGVDRSDYRAQALALANEATDLAARVGNAHRLATSAAVACDALIALGQAGAAFPRLDEARRLADEHGYANLALEIDLTVVQALRAIDKPAEAEALADRLLERLGTDSNSDLALRVHEELFVLRKQGGRLGEALAHHERIMALTVASLEAAAGIRSRILLNRIEVEQAQHRADIERLRAEALRRMAYTDALTGLANRHEVERRLPTLLADAVRSEQGWCAAVIDIDHFKRVNDDFGHEVGDAVLVEVGRILAHGTRPGDLVARIGGEEFLLVLVNAPVDVAQRACERLRLAVATHEWQAIAPGLRVTASVGVSPNRSGDDSRSWISRADQALYDAKHRGRDLVVMSR